MVKIPRKYRNEFGQLEEHAPYYERDFRVPVLKAPVDAPRRRTRCASRNGGRNAIYIVQNHPCDVVGWDGYCYPYAFNVEEFAPITGKLHMPPPAHATFEAPGAAFCAFVPRLFDYHPLAIPVPYNHSSVDCDEVLYYVSGNFMSRRGVDEGSITLHAAGAPHGPQPGAVEASLGKTSTDEIAVMVDTFKPLLIAQAAIAVRRPGVLPFLDRGTRADLERRARYDSIRPRAVPNPIRRAPARSHQPRSVTSSPFSRNARLSPLGSVIGRSPFHVSSMKLPCVPGSLPLIVPEAKRSPGRATAPLAVACASCCATLQYVPAKFVREISCGCDPGLAHPCASAVRPRARSSYADGRASRRYASGSGSCGGPWTRNGSSASSVTTHGETVVAKDFPKKRPERLVLPGLNVARAPIVHQEHAEDVLGSVVYGNRLAEFVRPAR